MTPLFLERSQCSLVLATYQSAVATRSFCARRSDAHAVGIEEDHVSDKPLAQAMYDRLFEPLRLQHTALPASAVNTLPDPYSHGYLYGSASVAMVGTPPYSPQVQAAARAGTLLSKDYTGLNHSFAAAAGGVISAANDLATWIQVLVGGRVLDATYQRRWLDSPQPEDPNKPDGQQYGYGIAKLHWGPNTMYFHGGRPLASTRSWATTPATRSHSWSGPI